MKENFNESFEDAIIRKFPQQCNDAVLRWKSSLWIFMCKAKIVLQKISTIPVDRRRFSLKMKLFIKERAHRDV